MLGPWWRSALTSDTSVGVLASKPSFPQHRGKSCEKCPVVFGVSPPSMRLEQSSALSVIGCEKLHPFCEVRKLIHPLSINRHLLASERLALLWAKLQVRLSSGFLGSFLPVGMQKSAISGGKKYHRLFSQPSPLTLKSMLNHVQVWSSTKLHLTAQLCPLEGLFREPRLASVGRTC